MYICLSVCLRLPVCFSVSKYQKKMLTINRVKPQYKNATLSFLPTFLDHFHQIHQFCLVFVTKGVGLKLAIPIVIWLDNCYNKSGNRQSNNKYSLNFKLGGTPWTLPWIHKWLGVLQAYCGIVKHNRINICNKNANNYNI